MTMRIQESTPRLMRAIGQRIPDSPEIPSAEAIALRIKLLLEEVGEYIEAAGLHDVENVRTILAYEESGHKYDPDTTLLVGAVRERIAAGAVSLTGLVDAGLDIAVIGYGGVLEAAGVEAATACEDQVSRSNVSKIDPDTGTVPRRADGKGLKREGYTPPQIERVIALAMERAVQ